MTNFIKRFINRIKLKKFEKEKIDKWTYCVKTSKGELIEPLGVDLEEVIAITFRVKKNPFMEDRLVKVYQTPDGHFIGKTDPLSQFSEIIPDASK